MRDQSCCPKNLPQTGWRRSCRARIGKFVEELAAKRAPACGKPGLRTCRKDAALVRDQSWPKRARRKRGTQILCEIKVLPEELAANRTQTLCEIKVLSRRTRRKQDADPCARSKFCPRTFAANRAQILCEIKVLCPKNLAANEDARPCAGSKFCLRTCRKQGAALVRDQSFAQELAANRMPPLCGIKVLSKKPAPGLTTSPSTASCAGRLLARARCSARMVVKVGGICCVIRRGNVVDHGADFGNQRHQRLRTASGRTDQQRGGGVALKGRRTSCACAATDVTDLKDRCTACTRRGQPARSTASCARSSWRRTFAPR